MVEDGVVGKQRARGAVKRMSHIRWVEGLPRLGYLVRGFLYATVGFLALQVALGAGGITTDIPGAIVNIGAQPPGKVTLVIIAIGLAGYSLWGFVRALLDPLNRGTSLRGLAERGGYLVSGFAYGVLILPTVRVALGAGRGGETDTQDWTAWLLSQSYGPWVVGGVGIVAMIGSLGQVYQSISASFKKDFKQELMSEREMKWAVRSGRFGLAARGVVFAMLGFFLVQAAWLVDHEEIRGLDGALRTVAQQSSGQVLLGIVALGLLAFGIFSALCARWIRVVPRNVPGSK
ncbi:MAG TPA: DUF1206 domain-containing protein [Chloroflexia bacterium]|nr:DUF1206 domain-containing protein [Chloroflexia bacterium]